MWPEIRRFASELPIVGAALRSAYRKANGLPDVGGAQTDAPDFNYHAWIERRIRERAADYPAPKIDPPRIDVLTLVYNVDANVLRKTAASVFAQDYTQWRWVVWDNGSTREDTRAVLAELAKEPRVKILCSAKNFGIATGHLKALELCDAEYVALLDHDDLFYSDALRIAAFNIDFYNRPDLLYSDEDKCDLQDRRYWPYFKPDFSPALLLDTGYTCHLSVAKLTTLRACGAFTDSATEGAQDWDMALRIHDWVTQQTPAASKRIVHIPEILYTWRGVPESTAVRGVDAKPHVIAAQKQCLESTLERRKLKDRFVPQPSRLFGAPDGHWEFMRRENASASVKLFTLEDSSRQDPAADPDFSLALGSGSASPILLERVDPSREDIPAALNRFLADSASAPIEFVAVLPFADATISLNWLHEALRVFALNLNASLVVGVSLDKLGIIRGGPVFLGTGRGVTVAYTGGADSEPGYFAMNHCNRNVSGFINAPWIGRCQDLRETGPFNSAFATLWEAEYCARVFKTGKEIVYAPLMEAVGDAPPATSNEELLRFVCAHHDVLRDDPYYTPFGSLKPESLYSIAEPAERAATLNPIFEKAGVPLISAVRHEISRYTRKGNS